MSKDQRVQSLQDMIREACIKLYEAKSFRVLLEQLYREGRYEGCIFAYEKLKSQYPMLLMEDQNFNNKFYLLLVLGKSLMKLGRAHEGIKIFEEAQEYLTDILGESELNSEESLQILFETAKALRKDFQLQRAFELI